MPVKKKTPFYKGVFCGGGGESQTHVLLGCQKTFYILSLSFFLNDITRVNTLYIAQKAK